MKYFVVMAFVLSGDGKEVIEARVINEYPTRAECKVDLPVFRKIKRDPKGRPVEFMCTRMLKDK